MMRVLLRCLIVLGMAAASLAATAQQPRKIPQVGYLGPGTRDSNSSTREAFLRGMRDQGLVDGRDFAFEPRYWGSDHHVLARAIDDLVRLKVDVIVTAGVPPVRAARAATRTIPIVMTAVGDPVESGLIDSLARPGGNITGLTVLSKELAPKRIQLIKEAVSGVARVAILLHADNPLHHLTAKDLESVALPLGLTLRIFEARRPEDFELVFAAMRQWQADASMVLDEGVFVSNRAALAVAASRQSVPLVCGFREMAEAGCLLSYAPSLSVIFHGAAAYVAKILRGEHPGDLPVEQPTGIELVVNLRTAKALGLAIPPAILARADEVIE